MAMQKIVVKVTMNTDKKARKALKIAVSLPGVESAAFVGSDKDQIAVTGEGIDSVELTTLLRKGVGYTELVSVGPVQEKKPEAKKPAEVQVQFNPYQKTLSVYDPAAMDGYWVEVFHWSRCCAGCVDCYPWVDGTKGFPPI